jgi:hypothetical protein
MESELLNLVNQKSASLSQSFFSKLFSLVSQQAAQLASTSQPEPTSPLPESFVHPSISEFISFTSSEYVGLVSSRQLWTEFVSGFASYCCSFQQEKSIEEGLISAWTPVAMNIWKKVIQVLSERGVAFEEQVRFPLFNMVIVNLFSLVFFCLDIYR